ncbi:MAG TPA: SH3 domain-containing protein [Thermomicrobiales bacterium]|nr:SH3 domain-containing protein [Thermomicrobiales bacterium]
MPASAQTPSSASDPNPKPMGIETDQTQPLGGATWRVYGYQEGLVGHTTANGHVIQPEDFFVALPCFCVLSSNGGNEFQVRLDYKGKSITVPVWDVGPWNVSDNYWDPPEQREWQGLEQGMPMATAAYYQNYNNGNDGWGRKVTSPGGIDIGDGAFHALGMTGSDWVDVTFLWLEPKRWELAALPAPYENITTVWWAEQPPLGRAEVNTSGNFGYIWETGHNVPNPMINLYWANGGWRRYGMPISEFFREVSVDGTVRFVQYFERAVLTLDLTDPNAPAVHQEDIGYGTYIDPNAAKPVEVYEPHPNGRFFPETGHTLQNGFKAYWEQNGGLDVFGMPLSEEWSETNAEGRKVVMQVFERARLEWWPDRVGTDEEITRGLLGVELLQRRGLLP